MYATYDFYTGPNWYGTAIVSADFPRLALRASDFLDYYTRGKAAQVPPEDTATVTALGKACCAVAEAIQSDERVQALKDKSTSAGLAGSGELKSESVGSYSVSYAIAGDYDRGGSAAAANDRRAAYAVIAREYLANTGLLYRGC